MKLMIRSIYSRNLYLGNKTISVMKQTITVDWVKTRLRKTTVCVLNYISLDIISLLHSILAHV